MPKKRDSYDNESLTLLKDEERVRKRPAVIFGSDGLDGCCHSFFEILSNLSLIHIQMCIRDRLYDEGLINQTFGAEFNPQVDYGFTAVEGESENPQKVYDIIIDMISKTQLNQEDFERIKKVVWGDYIDVYKRQ